MSFGPGSKWLRCAALALAIAAALGAIVSMALPSQLDEQGFDADERAVVAALRQIGKAQQHCRAATTFDFDGDRKGEFACLGELGGCARLRLDSDGRLGPDYLPEPLLPLEYTEFRTGALVIATFLVQVFVPGRDGGWVTDSDDGGGAGCRVDVDRSENSFVAYAWPSPDSRRCHAFCLDAAGRVRAFDNADLVYRGLDDRPPADAALPPDATSMDDSHRVGRDGNVWFLVR